MDDDKITKIEKNPNDFIIQGKESFALLYNIFNRTKKSQEIQEKQLKIQEQQLKLLNNILNEQKAEADEGEVLRLSGTATTTTFTIVNTITDPRHPVKAFEFINDGNNSVYVGFNVVQSSEGADTTDVTNDLPRFDLVKTTETLKYSYNRRKIRNIYLLSQNGNSAYRLKLIW